MSNQINIILLKKEELKMLKLKTETTESKTTLVKTQDEQYIYELTHELNIEGKSTIIITLTAGDSVTTRSYDRTKYFIINNLAGLGYKKITMYTLFTKVSKKFKSSSYTDEEIKDSLNYLKKLLNKGNYDEVIVALGVAHEKDKKVIEVKKILFELLQSYSEKVSVMKIIDTMGLYNSNETDTIHPLYAGNYFGGRWKIIPYDISKAYANLLEKKKSKTEITVNEQKEEEK